MSEARVPAESDAAPRKPWWQGWLEAFKAYRHPRVLAMLFLGFSAGLPFMLVFSTLSAWLREVGVERATIGMLSWVGIIYSIKFFWAPVVDRLPLPVLGRLLGRRRSWMLVAQVGIAVGLVNMAHLNPVGNLGTMAALALLVAFSSATQDISIDAWRIEAAPQPMQGVMAAAYQLGYRIAIMVGSAGALWIAADFGWMTAYTAMAVLVGVGIVTTLSISEPQPRVAQQSLAQEQRVIDWLERKAHWPLYCRVAYERDAVPSIGESDRPVLRLQNAGQLDPVPLRERDRIARQVGLPERLADLSDRDLRVFVCPAVEVLVEDFQEHVEVHVVSPCANGTLRPSTKR